MKINLYRKKYRANKSTHITDWNYNKLDYFITDRPNFFKD